MGSECGVYALCSRSRSGDSAAAADTVAWVAAVLAASPEAATIVAAMPAAAAIAERSATPALQAMRALTVADIGNGYRGYGYAWRGYPYRGYRYAGYGWRWGYPWWGFGYAGWGWGYPWWGWGGGYYDNSYYNYYPSDAYPAQAYPAYTYPPADAGDYSQDNQTQDQIDRLTGEVNQLRSQQSLGQSKTAEIHAETVLVYRDGHTEEVQNYAIVGKTIWIFNESRARKVAISELDVPATKRDNEDRGIDFVLPGSSR